VGKSRCSGQQGPSLRVTALESGKDECTIGHGSILELSSRLPRRALGPECTRISCHAALDMATSAAFRKESRMKLANATNLDRKSGIA
jgi:hypothetical protein